MVEPTSIEIECPICEKKTKLDILKTLNKDEFKEELDWFSNNKEDMVSPEMTEREYDVFSNNLQDGETTIYVMGKIKSHKLGLFDKKCPNSNRYFKVLFYFFVNHKDKLGGSTFRIGEEIKYSVEMLNIAERWAKYCTTLNKESISIVVDMLVKKNCTFTGDVAMILQLSTDLRPKFQCVTADSSMKPDELKSFIVLLRDKLEDNGEDVRVVIVDSKLFTIECFKDDKWLQCVAVAPKGYSVN